MTIDHTARAHSPIGPSGAHRWMNCPGSVAAQVGKPDTAGEAARFGTLCHEVLETTLLHPERVMPEDTRDDVREMLEPVLLYIQNQEWLYGASVIPEQRVDLSFIHPAMFGTLDVLLETPSYIEVIDLKSGRVRVEPDDPQFVLYGAAALQRNPDARFVTTVAQPRHGEPRAQTWERDEWEAVLAQAAITAAQAVDEDGAPDPSAPRFAGSWCDGCKAHGECPTAHAHMRQLAAREFAPPVATLTDEQIGQCLTLESQVQSWFKALRKEAYARALRGETEHYKLVAGRAGNRKWSDEAQVRQVCAELGVDPVEPTLRSPAQIEKELGKKRFADMLGECVTRAEGKPTLAPASDPRPAVTSAEMDFGTDDE